MRLGIFQKVRFVLVWGVLTVATPFAAAQDTQDQKTPAAKGDSPPENASKPATPPGKKTKAAGDIPKVSEADKKPRPGQYATEAEARGHCRGTIVWADQNHFNHYAGSREYGRKPGGFACEN